MVFLGKGYEPWHGSCYIPKHAFGSHSRDRKKMSPSNSDSNGNWKIFLAHVPLKEAPSFCLFLCWVNRPGLSPLILMAHYSHLSSFQWFCKIARLIFMSVVSAWRPSRRKSACCWWWDVCFAALSLFGSAGSVHSLGGVLPELLRSFQAGERSGSWCPCLRDLISRADAVAWG